jgi:hypothetical protein
MTRVGKGAILSLSFDNRIGSDGEYVIGMVAYGTERDKHGISDSVMFVYDQPGTLRDDILNDLPRADRMEREDYQVSRDYDIPGGYIWSLHDLNEETCMVTYSRRFSTAYDAVMHVY